MITHRWLRVLFAASVAALGACGGKDSDAGKEPPREEPRSRRVIEPPVGTVRPLPPHLISSAGVGPYHLGDRLSDLMQQLPSGPRMALFEIPGVLHRNLLRAEEDSVLVGGEPGSVASFIAIVDPKVARTESGLHVGATREDVEALGPPTIELDRARDPRIVMPPAPKGAKVLFAQTKDKAGNPVQRVGAIVVASDARTIPQPAPGACARPTPTTRPADVRAGRLFGACLSGAAAGELVQIVDGEIVARAPDSDKPVTFPFPLPAGVAFVAPLRIEDRDELVVVMRSEQSSERTWSVFALRMEGGKLVRTLEPYPAYTITSANARWIGVELAEIDLLLEVSANGDAVEISGLLATHLDVPEPGMAWRDVVVLSSVPLPRKHGKSALSEGSGSGDGSARPLGPDGGSPSANGSGSGMAP